MTGMLARRVVVHGRVQGVFFRDATQREAERMGVDGWVTNRSDGVVEAHLEGPPEDVDVLVRWCREGPSSADVTEVEVSEVEAEGHAGFTVR